MLRFNEVFLTNGKEVVMKWLEKLKDRADVWKPIDVTKTDGTSTWTDEPLCVQDIVTVEIPKSEFDRLIAIVEVAEWAIVRDQWVCTCCGSKKPNHILACPYSDEWEGP